MGILTHVFFLAGLAVHGLGQTGSDDPESPAPNLSFAQSCTYNAANLTDGHWLGAYCCNNMTDVFGYNYTWIDLDLCVGNNASQLIAYEGGNYSTSCIDCHIRIEEKVKTLMLICSCPDADDHYQKSSLDLNTTIYDDDGAAACFDHRGNKSQHGPGP